MKVYLAGPITGLTWEEATGWRQYMTLELKPHGITCYSPLRFKTFLSHLNGNKIADSYAPETSVLATPHGITMRDRWDATRCDVLFVNFLGAKQVSIGTVLEVSWADSKRVPIVIAMEEDNIHNHSMIKQCAGFVVPTLREGIDVVVALLKTEDN